MSEVKSKTIIPKRATKTKFASSESVLKEGEIALIYPDTGPGTGAAKLVSGDGATVAKNLPIAIDGEAIDELKNSLDIAKKIIPITLTFAGWKSVNGDNSAPYVQTVINEELKSSMNPDLVSMLDENATPDEQDVYNKNLAIISQGVGTVNNGSITYKVYKLPSADITIGLTRLGGVKEVETASGVDDVKVGGVSVVKDKVAEIPEIPSTENFVPYTTTDEGKCVLIGDPSVAEGKDGTVLALAKDDIEIVTKKTYSNSVDINLINLSQNNGLQMQTTSTDSNSNATSVEITELSYGNFRNEIAVENEAYGYALARVADESHSKNGAKLLAPDGSFTNLSIADPTEDEHAATRRYVDDAVYHYTTIIKTHTYTAKITCPSGKNFPSFSTVVMAWQNDGTTDYQAFRKELSKELTEENKGVTVNIISALVHYPGINNPALLFTPIIERSDTSDDYLILYITNVGSDFTTKKDVVFNIDIIYEIVY